MKIKYIGLSSLLVLFFMSCKAQIEIGKSIDSFMVINNDSTVYLLTSPAQFEKGYEITFDSINYRVAITDKRKIKFIETTDLKFKTEEGTFVGMPYSSISKEKIKSKIYDLKGWGKALKLSSGWYAVFDFKQSLTDSSPIQFFYKKQ
jgi:hypothetical protein